jgi:hypothetical protein
MSVRRIDRKIADVIRKQIQPIGWFPKRATIDDDDIQPLVRRFTRTASISRLDAHRRTDE